MRKIKHCDVTTRYVRHMMNLFYLSKYVFHMPNPEELMKEFSLCLVEEALEKVKKLDDADIEYSFNKHSELYVEDFFEREASPPTPKLVKNFPKFEFQEEQECWMEGD